MTLVSLFSYGTLVDKEVQSILFGQEIKSYDVILYGWAKFEGDDGYYYIAREPGSHLKGNILELTQEQLWICDQWEEVPLYKREYVEVVKTEGGNKVKAWVYTRDCVVKKQVKNEETAGVNRKIMLNSAKKLGEQLERKKLPYSDVYLFFPCIVTSSDCMPVVKGSIIEENWINKIKSVIELEDRGNINKSLTRGLFDTVEIAIKIAEGIYDYQTVNIFYTGYRELDIVVLTMTIPAIWMSTLHLLQHMKNESIEIIIENESENNRIQFYDWLKSKSLKLQGTPRASMFLSENVNKEILSNLLLTKEDPTGKIRDENFIEGCYIDIEKYDSAKIYLSDMCVVEIFKNFQENYEDRIIREILILCIIEFILIQKSANAINFWNTFRIEFIKAKELAFKIANAFNK